MADLVETDPDHELGTWCAYVDPSGEDVTYEEAHREFWGATAVREAPPAVRALRSVEQALDGVDAVDFRPGLLDSLMERRAQLGGSPDWVPGRLTAALAEERGTVLEEHGLTLGLWQFLEYRHLPLDGGRSLYVRPALPWPHTGRGLATRSTPRPRQASVDRHRAARQCAVETVWSTRLTFCRRPTGSGSARSGGGVQQAAALPLDGQGGLRPAVRLFALGVDLPFHEHPDSRIVAQVLRNDRAQRQLTEALGIRDTSAQASALLAALEVGSTETFSPEHQALLQRAEKRARQIV